jgi:hypothetical protein
MVPPPTRVLFRGLTRRCGRCGSGKLFRSWFKMVDRCPRCGYLFNREEGFFLGALLINFAVTEILLGVVLGAMIGVLASGGGQSLTPIVITAIGETILVPVLFYPFSRTTWAAIDLMLHRGEAWAASPNR